MARPFPYILLLLLFIMSSISLGAKNKKTGKTYNVRHKNQGWKIKTTGGREKVHNDDQKGKEEGHDDYQTELVDDTDDIYQSYDSGYHPKILLFPRHHLILIFSITNPCWDHFFQCPFNTHCYIHKYANGKEDIGRKLPSFRILWKFHV